MTSYTPEQLRSLAVTHFPTASRREREVMDALRSAASQIEAINAAFAAASKRGGKDA